MTLFGGGGGMCNVTHFFSLHTLTTVYGAFAMRIVMEQRHGGWAWAGSTEHEAYMCTQSERERETEGLCVTPQKRVFWNNGAGCPVSLSLRLFLLRLGCKILGGGGSGTELMG